MNLIINADDFGLTKDTNTAVEELTKIGVLTSTTVMVNMPYASEITNLLQYEALGIGLHFNLTQGKPISDIEKIPSLVNDKGGFYTVKEFKDRVKKGFVNKDDVLRELEAQYKKLEYWIGSRITHIDSHQDINKLTLISHALCEFTTSLNVKLGLRVYNKCYVVPKNTIIHPGISTIFTFGIKRSVTEMIFRSRRSKLSKYFNLPDGMLYTRNNNIRTLLKLLSKQSNFKGQKDMVLEVMCHPATSTDELTETKMLASRVEEYQILKSEDFQKVKQKYILINFSNL